jgi:orotate phosphoribosyltransferase
MPNDDLAGLYDEYAALLQQYCFSYGDFILASGQRSNYYYNGKLVTLAPRGSYLTGRLVFEALRGRGIEAIGGKTLGADPIVTATALVSSLEGEPIPAFIVRGEQKDHGKKDRVAAAYGPGGDALLGPGRRVAIVDDTATTGGSLFEAVQAAEEAGCTVALLVAIVDRQQGAADNFRSRGYAYRALYLADGSGRLQQAPAV